MSQEKYVIVDIHPADAFYEQKDRLIGQVVCFRNEINNNYEYYILNVPNGEGYTAGDVEFYPPVELIVTEGNAPEVCETGFFFAVKVAPLS